MRNVGGNRLLRERAFRLNDAKRLPEGVLLLPVANRGPNDPTVALADQRADHLAHTRPNIGPLAFADHLALAAPNLAANPWPDHLTHHFSHPRPNDVAHARA